MRKKNRIKDEALIYVLLIMLILVFIFTGFGKTITNLFNTINENLFFIKDKNIIISDKVTKTYINSLESDITELKEIVSLNKGKQYNCINSTVISRDPAYWYNTLTINKGSKDGIKKNSMVMNNTGLIGTITETFDNSSIISLLTNVDEKRKITVAIKTDEKEVYGLISKYDFNKNELTISEVTSDIKYIDGVDVITTDLTNTYKGGIIIGVVKEIVDDKNSLSKILKVIPNTNFNNIKYVCVLGE